MRRRDLILQTIGAPFAMAAAAHAARQPGMDDDRIRRWREDLEHKRAEIEAKAIAAFPFPRIIVPGANALSTWQKLKAAGHGIPIVLGDEKTVVTMTDAFDPSFGAKPVPDVLDAAARIKIPGDLFARRNRQNTEDTVSLKNLLDGPDSSLPKVIESKDANGRAVYTQIWSVSFPPNADPGAYTKGRVLTPDETRAFFAAHKDMPAVGQWPKEPQVSSGLSVATDILTGRPLPKVYIALIPTDDWTTIPAHLHWGGWNDCPPPEYHVAVLRSWRDRFGVELVGMSFDVMNLRVARPPRTRETALDLAREQYAYCTDIVDQGTQTLSVLAASVMTDWWFFWWD